MLGQIQPQAEAKQRWPSRHGWDLLSESRPVPQRQQLHSPSAQPRRLLSKISCFWQRSAGLWLPALLRRGPWAASPSLCLLAASCLATQHLPFPFPGTWDASRRVYGLCLGSFALAPSRAFFLLLASFPTDWGKRRAKGLSFPVPAARFQERAEALPGRMLLIP